MKRFALLGHNIDYSLSPRIHGLIYKRYGIEASYTLMSAEPEKLRTAVNELRRYDGFNITKPYKVAIMPFLEEDHSGCGSVNTVICRAGKLYGYNTDGYGFSKHFKEHFSAEGKSVLVLGAGGAARTVVRALLRMDAAVYIFNRTSQKAEDLAAETGAKVFRGEKPQFIVNCTSCGLLPGENPLNGSIDLSQIKGAYDTIYAPPETDFLKACKAAGAATVNGLGMLVHQAIRACELMCEIHCDDKAYRKIMKELRKGR